MENRKIDLLKFDDAQRAAGLSNAELAEKAGLSMGAVLRARRGESCRKITLLRLARALNVKLEALMED